MADQGSIANLKQNIDDNIYQNTDYDITGGRMNTVLQNIVDTLEFNGRDFFNVNEYREKSNAYANAAAARAAVPDEVKKIGLVITFLLSDGWYIEQFNGDDINDWDDADNWIVNGPISIYANPAGGIVIRMGNDVYTVAKQEDLPPIYLREGSADYEVCDENGFAIIQYKNGHLKTKKFDSSKVVRTENGNPLSDFDIEDEMQFAILRIQDGFPKTKRFDGQRIQFFSDITENSGIYQNVVVNISDYGNNLLNVYAAINPTKYKHYTILIPEGTYDVSSWFSQAQIENSNETHFRGVEMRDYTKLLGVGAADKVILQWMNPDDATHWGYISTLNTGHWNELENLTVKANNIRYAVHDDFWENTDRFLRIKRCNFIVSGNTSRAWGGGCNGGYDAIFEDCKFIMEYYAPYELAPQSRYIEPFVLHDNYFNTRGDSHLVFENCRFNNPYTAFKYYYSESWEQITYNSSYPEYDYSKEDYAINDCVNMPNDTTYSYKCLYANSQVPPYANGRPCINLGFGAEDATRVLYADVIGCELNTYLWVAPKLTRVMGYGNKMKEQSILSGESTENKNVIIDII